MWAWHDVAHPLRAGEAGPRVTVLQLRLNALGLGPIDIDGDFGSQTQQAVVRLQVDRALSADGAVGTDTWRVLLADHPGTDASSPKEEIAAMQLLLRDVGLGPTLQGTGAFGPKTAAAVAALLQLMNADTTSPRMTAQGWWRLIGRDASLIRAIVDDRSHQVARNNLRGEVGAALASLPPELQERIGPVLHAAVATYGIREVPDGVNGGPLLDQLLSFYWGGDPYRGPATKWPWCALIVSQWIHHGLGLTDWASHPFGTWRAAVEQIRAWGSAQQRIRGNTTPNVTPGSVFIMSRAGSGSDGGGGGSSSTDPHKPINLGHTGLVLRDLGDEVKTIEGNVGNRVKTVIRRKRDLIGFVEWWS
jgi:peptidoglycan hydrolase-like protein with peptidoglycan-binding domain